MTEVPPADFTQAVDHLIRVEPRFAAIAARHGLPPLRLAEPGLRSLLRIVTDQLISLKAGEAIWRRLEQRLSPFEPDTILSCTEADLRALGLTGAKARTFLAAALAFRDGEFDCNDMDDAQVMARLTALPGIGPWTAEIYMLTALSRADAWPAGDLALQVAAQDILGLDKRPDQRAMRLMAEPWRPHRAMAARLLWSHYRGLKGMPQNII